MGPPNPSETCDQQPKTLRGGGSESPFRVRPLVWKHQNASYVHERMVGTPQVPGGRGVAFGGSYSWSFMGILRWGCEE